MSMEIPPRDSANNTDPSKKPTYSVGRIKYDGEGKSRDEKKTLLLHAAQKEIRIEETLKPAQVTRLDQIAEHLFGNFLDTVPDAINLLRKDEDYSLAYFAEKIDFGHKVIRTPSGVELIEELFSEPAGENKFKLIQKATNLADEDSYISYEAELEIDPRQESAQIRKLLAKQQDKTVYEYTEGSSFTANGVPDTLFFVDLSPIHIEEPL